MLEDFHGYFQPISDPRKNNSLDVHDNSPF